jgi:UDP-N-acetylglucosamine acyltransferase
MATIHPTAEVDSRAQLADDVEIGRGCVISGDVRIAAGTRLIGNVYIQGPATIGERNLIYPFVCLGFAPQYRGKGEGIPSAGLVIGDDNILREHFTMHQPTGEAHPTRLGDDNYMMVHSHIGHDAQVGNRNTFANCAALGGHVIVEDQCTLGGLSAVHQFSRLGRLCMLGGGTITTRDVPPFTIVVERSTASGPNMVGMKRAGFSREQVNDVHWAFRVMFREGHSLPRIRELLQQRADGGSDPAREILTFLEKSNRPLVAGRRKSQRGGEAEA